MFGASKVILGENVKREKLTCVLVIMAGGGSETYVLE
jgi:hypothetical protein